MTYLIREANAQDFARLADIEKAAAILFSEVGLPEIAEHDPTDLDFIEAAARAGVVLIAVVDGAPAGFLLAAPLDRHTHIYELSVHPAHGRKGLGRQLVEAVCDWAEKKGDQAVTLSTFRDIAWNGPFYASCGFEEIARHEWTPALLLAHYREEGAGLPMERRCFMRKSLH
jgi:GNAT superfamily N-acetyltransferase